MAASTREAIECIRAGLATPSLVMPFMEPSLPYYDSIRDTSEFIELVADQTHRESMRPWGYLGAILFSIASRLENSFSLIKGF